MRMEGEEELWDLFLGRGETWIRTGISISVFFTLSSLSGPVRIQDIPLQKSNPLSLIETHRFSQPLCFDIHRPLRLSSKNSPLSV